MSVLTFLAARPRAVATHQELLAECWLGAVSSPNGVHKCILELRRAFATGGDAAIYVETLPKRGYRLVAPVVAADALTERPVEPHQRNGSRAPALQAYVIQMGDRSALLVPGDPRSQTPGVASFHEAIEREVVARAGQQGGVSIRSFAMPADVDARPQLAAQADADYAVDIDVQAVEDSLRVALVITPVEAELPAHHEQFEAAGADRLHLVGDVIARGVTVLGVLLDDRHLARMREWGTRNVHAYRYLLEGAPLHRSLSYRTMARSVELLEKAVAEDPRCAAAYEMLSRLIPDLGMVAKSAQSKEETRQKVQALLRHARHWDIDPSIVAQIDRQYRRLAAASAFDAEAMWSKEITNDPTSVAALRHYGGLLVGAGLFDESQAYLARAIDLAAECEHDWLELDEVTLASARGELEKAVELMKRNLERFPENTLSTYALVRVLAKLKRFTEAESYVSRLEATDRGWAYYARVTVMALRGDLPIGSAALSRAFSDRFASNSVRGAVCFFLGDIEGGLRYWREMEPGFLHMQWQFNSTQEWFWAPGVVDDPRYQALLDELGFGSRWKAHMRTSVAALAPITGIALTTPPVGRAFAG